MHEAGSRCWNERGRREGRRRQREEETNRGQVEEGTKRG
jgi:hypothetical protein